MYDELGDHWVNIVKEKIEEVFRSTKPAYTRVSYRNFYKSTTEQIVDEVIAGKWGNGADRKKALTDAGYNYHEIQYMVNRRMRPSCQFKIKNVIFNDPATIVFWTDGTKTVVKAQGNDIFDPEKGLAMAIVKKQFGNQGNYYNEFSKWLPEEVEENPTITLSIDGTALAKAFREVFGNR